MLKKIIPITLCAIMLIALIPMAIVGMSNDEKAQGYNELNASSMNASEVDYTKDEKENVEEKASVATQVFDLSSDSDIVPTLEDEKDYVEILKVCDNEEEFVLGCDFETIIYGIPEMEYEGKFYQFIDGKLYVSQGDHEKKRVIVEQDGDNINIFDGVMYYTVFEDGKAYIRALDIETESISNVLETGTEKICYMYVINNELLMYLADGIVYQCLLGSEDIQRVSPRDDIYNFIPTFDGNVYATGNRWNNTLYFNEMHLADGVSYYSIIKEHLVVSFTAEFFQCPMKTLVIAYSEEGTQEFDLESNMVLYNLDGEDEYEYTDEEYGEERDCTCCEEGW